MPGTYQIIAADRTITLTDFPLLDPDFFIVPSDIQMLYDPDDQSGDQAVGVSWRWVSRGGEEIDASKLVAESYVTVRPSSDRIVVATCKTEPTCSAYWLGAQGGYITCRDIFGNIFETGFGSVPRGSSCHVGTSVAPLGCGDVFPADGLGNLSGDDWLNEPCIWTPFFVRPAANQYFSCWTGALTSVREYDRKILLHDSETTAHFVPWNGWEALGDSDRGGGVSRYGPRGNSVEGGSRCPSLALTSDGRPVVAWISDICDWIIPVHQNTDVYCRVWDGTQWTGFGSSDQQGGLTQYPAFVQSMGPPYPTYPQSTAICLDSQDRPIVAWTKTGAGEGEVFVARWDGSIWTGLGCTLGGPGISGISWNPVGGLTLVLKMNPSGNPVLATPSQVLTWNGSSWDTMSLSTHDDFTLDGSGNPVVAWGDDPVYVAYWDGSSWAGLGCSLAYPAGGVMAGEKPTLCAAPDGKIALACWDDSINDIRVAIWNGSTWDSPGGSEATSIFGALSPVQKPDSSELSAPQGMRIALSTDGAPIVAWIDDFSFISSGTAGGDQGNGVLHIAQWNGVKWAEIGPGSASGRGLGNVSGCGVKEAALAVGEDGLPVVAWTEYSFYRYFEGPDPCPMRQVFLKRFRSGYTNPVEDGPPSAFLYAPNVTADETFGNAYSGLVPMIWTVTDIGGDAASIAAEYSTDDGATWLPATLYESTAGSAAGNSITGIPALPAPRGRWWLYWESDTDGVGMAASASVRFRITPSDEEGAGTPSVTSLFTIDNSGFQATFSANPVAAFGKTYPAGSRWNPSVVGGIVEIPISVIDEPLRQKCSVTFDYSDDGGSTWKPMTITESQNGVLIPPNTVETLTPSRGLYPVPSAPVSNSTIIKWDSISDGIGLSTPCQNVSIRLTPSSEDGRTGNACCHNGLTVDNFTPPQIAVATPTEGSGNTTVIEFSYTDHRSSTITLEFQYSTDGTTWCDASSLSSTVYLLFGDPASCPVMDPPFPWPTAGSYGTCYIVSGNQVSTAIRDYQWPYVRVTWDNGAQLGTAFVGNVKVRLRGIDPLLGAGPWAETAFFGVDNTQ
jgi:hypothetical protein